MSCIKTYPLPDTNMVCMQFAGHAGTISRFYLGDVGIWTVVFDTHGNIRINLQTPEYELPIYDFTGTIGSYPSDFSLCEPENTLAIDSTIFDTFVASKLQSGNKQIHNSDLEHSFTYCDTAQNLDLAIDVKVGMSDNSTFTIHFNIYDRTTRVEREFAENCATKNTCEAITENLACQGTEPPEGRKVIFKYRRRLDLS